MKDESNDSEYLDPVLVQIADFQGILEEVQSQSVPPSERVILTEYVVNRLEQLTAEAKKARSVRA